MYYIYRATNKSNGKFYIGRCAGPVEEREYKHWWYATNKNANTPFPNALRKYGRENFEWDIVEEVTSDTAGEREIYWIQKLQPQYNATLGGDGGRFGVPCPEHVKEATRQSRIVSVRDRTTGKEYASMKDAREDTGVLESSISRSLRYNGPGSRWEKIMSP